MPKQKPLRIDPLKSHKISSSDKFFLDTNVWLYILGKDDNEYGILYSEFLSELCKKNATVLINQELVSELINRYLRDDAKTNGFGNFKEYRKTEHYRECFKEISAVFEQLITSGRLKFESINMTENDFLDYIKSNTQERQKPILDYKDFAFDIFAKNFDLILVTHDGDFFGSKYPRKFLTANKKLYGKIIYQQ